VQVDFSLLRHGEQGQSEERLARDGNAENHVRRNGSAGLDVPGAKTSVQDDTTIVNYHHRRAGSTISQKTVQHAFNARVEWSELLGSNWSEGNDNHDEGAYQP